ncbi:MAG TPA: hypothetical protein VFV95_10660 [Vicinamibacterales bacterium]|nr:hypothetical protein [Vicinamibacterales bacterium]
MIRIVGPAFEMVSGWAEKGVPITVACRGIDQYFERYYAKGPRRRPVRVEFCEADVLTVFDEWRRAVGVRRLDEAVSHESDAADDSGAPRTSLPAHLDRAVARLGAWHSEDVRLEALARSALRELEGMRPSAKSVRGPARQEMCDRLRALDGELLEALRQQVPAAELEEIGVEADAELAPFKSRMPMDAYAGARKACIDRIVRERARLPAVTFDP